MFACCIPNLGVCRKRTACPANTCPHSGGHLRTA
ncbi:unnamed protein product [Gulo gulo]|uniref:Uncharacterized protein n=1 Tax=Gulo gulo TaxID=48420 RepID=A0A9X9Q0A9_GULGU|nr:unnamed protein product [Gulo gulo]